MGLRAAGYREGLSGDRLDTRRPHPTQDLRHVPLDPRPRELSDLVLEGDSTDPDIPASDFRLERFAEGRPLASLHPYVGAGEMR